MEKMKLPFIDSDLLYMSFIDSDLLYIQVSFNAGLTIIMFSFHFFYIFNIQKRACSILYLISILPRFFQIL